MLFVVSKFDHPDLTWGPKVSRSTIIRRSSHQVLPPILSWIRIAFCADYAYPAPSGLNIPFHVSGPLAESELASIQIEHLSDQRPQLHKGEPGSIPIDKIFLRSPCSLGVALIVIIHTAQLPSLPSCHPSSIVDMAQRSCSLT